MRHAWFPMHGEKGPVRALVVQLARLGDLVQSAPAIAALHAHLQLGSVNLLCAAPLTSIGLCLPGVDRVFSWEVERWRSWSARWPHESRAVIGEVERYLLAGFSMPYDIGFNLNQHTRAILAATLLCKRVVGPGACGPLSDELPPWAEYLREVVQNRRHNRVHLADVFCGLCGVRPLGLSPRLQPSTEALPSDMASIGMSTGPWVAMVVGAGEIERCIPVTVWHDWIHHFLKASPGGQIVLIGSGTDQARAHALQDGLPSLSLGRVWDCTGRTSLLQTAALLARCHWVIGSDTGPLHLGCAVGTRALGFYFARARVHETGPYGDGHWIWQAQASDDRHPLADVNRIKRWPLAESVRLVLEDRPSGCDGWMLWKSGVDGWGAYYVTQDGPIDSGEPREDVWGRVHRPVTMHASDHEYV